MSRHTTTQNKDTLLSIKIKESLRMHLKEAQESERRARIRWRRWRRKRRRANKDNIKMGLVLKNHWRQRYVGYFYFLFHLHIFSFVWILVTGRFLFSGWNPIYKPIRLKRVWYDQYLNQHKTLAFLCQYTCRNIKYQSYQPVRYEIDFLTSNKKALGALILTIPLVNLSRQKPED